MTEGIPLPQQLDKAFWTTARTSFIRGYITAKREGQAAANKLPSAYTGDLNKHLAQEIDLILKIVGFLDTRDAKHKDKRETFKESIRPEVKKAGFTMDKVMQFGRTTYNLWIQEKHRIQAQRRWEQNPFADGASSTDPNFFLGDQSHRRGGV